MRRQTWFAPLLATLLVATSANAQCEDHKSDDQGGSWQTQTGDCVTLINGGGVTDSQLRNAGNLWNNSCVQVNLGEMPGAFLPGEAPPTSWCGGKVTVKDVGGVSASGDCGQISQPPTGNGDAVVELYDQYIDQYGNVQNCPANQTRTIAHELGHRFGLNDVSGCNNRLMDTLGFATQPHTNECAAVANEWTTNSEATGGGGGGGICFGPDVAVPVESRALSLDGAWPLSGGESQYRLNRTEKLDRITYLVDEWMVASWSTLNGERRLEVRNHSDTEFATYKSRELESRTAAMDYDVDSVALIVDSPIHPDNDRHIHKPGTRWLEPAIAYLGPPTWSVLRFDVDEHRLIRQVEILAQEEAFPTNIDLSPLGRRALQVDYYSDKAHRVFVYAVVEARAGRLSLRDSFVTLPRCCCSFADCDSGCDICIP